VSRASLKPWVVECCGAVPGVHTDIGAWCFFPAAFLCTCFTLLSQCVNLVEPVCQFSTCFSASILLSQCVNLESHYFVEPLLCWATTRYATMLSHLRLLSETRRLVDTHFLPSPYHFLAPRAQGNTQSTPSTICCCLWHTTTMTWSLPVLENQVHSGKNTSNLSHCAICLWLLCWATHCDTLIVLSHCFTILKQCATMLSPPLALCWTTCTSYATCHLTKHTPLVLFPTRDLLSLFPSKSPFTHPPLRHDFQVE